MASQKNKAAKETVKSDDLPPDPEATRDDYKVKLEVFEGPLDLLLYLIKKDQIDIYDIPIARITKQYLEYVQLLESLNIEVAGDFLVMAATLIYIKSKMLLPPEPKVEGEEDLNEDPRMELVEQLLEYQKFKSAANMLYEKAEIEGACYSRGELETDKNNPEITATVVDLLRVFKDILDRAKAVKEMEIHREEMSMSEKLTQIRTLLAERKEINVREVFEMAHSKRELILTFLAFLELVKESQILLVQQQLFGDIIARARENVPLLEITDAPKLAVSEEN
ncbi:MAG: segregation/condensation protein A [Acidobacteria bacterium]|nr:segregation/condensation protein A [Acidobacteriota bacterium]